MAVFLDRAAQQYNARPNPYSVSATIPAGLANPVRSISVTLTPSGEWPVGNVGEVVLTGPGGVEQRFIFAGAFLLSRSPQRGARFHSSGDQPFPAGSYSMSFKVLQTVSAAVLIEYFH
jgi:hypothetical protein